MRLPIFTPFVLTCYALAKQHGISLSISLTIISLMLLHTSQILPLAFVNKLEIIVMILG